MLILAGGAVLGLGLGLTSVSPSLAQGWGRDQPPGGGMGWKGSMRMGPNDQRFIVMMIPHHEGAIAMAELALTLARRPEIKALALAIKQSQTRENQLMSRWYRQWYGGDVPQWGGSYGRGAYSGWGGWMGGGMGMMGSGMGMGAMRNDLAWLRSAPDFDRAFIEQMVPHHRMGVMMASMALNNTEKAELRDLEQSMIRVQSDEIRQMEAWYRDWYGSP
jgi:uncharacterized protein (DUF305 family)